MIRKTIFATKIKSIGYRPETQLLEVKFGNSTAYQYFKVPNKIYDGLKHSHSKEKYYLKYIKYEYVHEFIDRT